MSVTSALRRLWGIGGRGSGLSAVRYDAISDRYVCPSGRHESENAAALTCACGRPPAAGTRALVEVELPGAPLPPVRYIRTATPPPRLPAGGDAS